MRGTISPREMGPPAHLPLGHKFIGCALHHSFACSLPDRRNCHYPVQLQPNPFCGQPEAAHQRAEPGQERTCWSCQECNWTNGGLLNVGEFGAPRWLCHGCLTRQARALAVCHDALADAAAALDPEQHPELFARLSRLLDHEKGGTEYQRALDEARDEGRNELAASLAAAEARIALLESTDTSVGRAIALATEASEYRLRAEKAVAVAQSRLDAYALEADRACAAETELAKAEAKLGRAEAEIERLKAERRAIQEDSRVVTCVFCGHQYEPGTPLSNHDALRAHVAICPSHPAAAFRARAEAAAARLLTEREAGRQEERRACYDMVVTRFHEWQDPREIRDAISDRGPLAPPEGQK